MSGPNLAGHRAGPKRVPPELRFWDFVDKGDRPDACWIFVGGRDQNGYGRFSRHNGLSVLAHRFAWETVHGPLPRGVVLCHRCDNPPCVRPDHLFPGTQRDNMRDAARKGRTSRWRAELTSCKHGHAFTPENTMWRDDRGSRKRRCRACHNRRSNERKSRLRSVA